MSRCRVGEPDSLRTDGVELRPCRACKCPLAMVMGPNGKVIPLDLRSQAYAIGRDLEGRAVAQPVQAWASHFKTCPSVVDFQKGKRK